jgi:hypothetical protein
MRRRIALQSILCEIHGRCLFCFARALGVRARPRVAFGRLAAVMQFRIQPYLGKFPVTPHRYT